MRKSFFFLFLALCCFAEEPALDTGNQLSSTHASYDGSSLILEGKVQLDHGLGTMSAERALLQKQDSGKDFPFSVIELSKKVFLSLKNRGELRCDEAQLDFNELKGTLFSSEGNNVSYIDSLKKEEQSSIALKMTSKQIALQFFKQSVSNSLEYQIEKLIGKKNVEIQYSEEFLLQADEASYHNCGDIKAYPIDETSTCTLFYQGESLKAELIDINTKKNRLQISKPQGTIPSKLFGDSQTSPLAFQANSLSWDHEKEVLTLTDQVMIQEKKLGTLFAEKELVLEQGKSKNKKFVKTLSIKGNSKLEHQDPVSGWKHTLSCYGSLYADGLKGQIALSSPPKNPLRYEDPHFILEADKALIEYENSSELKPLGITLNGNVTIRSNGSSSQVGVADRLTYSPDTKTIILSALPKKRVLFQDLEQNITMSAQEVHLTEDPSTGKMQAKGIGNVKLSLSEEEAFLLKKQFSLDKEV